MKILKFKQKCSKCPCRLSDEKRLTLELLRRYSKIGRSGRPVTDSSKPVTVYMGFGLKQMDLDEKNKVLTLSMWTRYVRF